jgi:hypothetical protein
MPLRIQVKALREGKSVDKPIYNHVTGLIDPPEKIQAPKVRQGGSEVHLSSSGCRKHLPETSTQELAETSRLIERIGHLVTLQHVAGMSK